MKLQSALITGATSGIGLATAEALAAEGMSLILWGRREDRLRKIQGDLQKRFEVAVVIGAVDVTKTAQIDRFVQDNAAAIGAVDVLVNNAGLAKGTAKLPELRLEDFDVMIDTNVKGLLYVTRALLPSLLKKPVSHVVNLGSVAGRWVYPGGATYCASKFAVRALSEGLRLDTQGSGLRVTNIEPGMVETEFSEVRFDGDAAKAKSVYKGMQPLAAEDIAETVAWCLRRPAHVNIQELVIFPTDQAAIQSVHRR